MLMPWFNRQSIRLRIFIPFLLISLITSFIFTVYGFMQSNAAIVNEIDRRLLICSYTMRLILPEDYFDRITGPGSIAEQEHMDNTHDLEAFLNNVGAKYLYAIYRHEGRYYFVASADPTTPFWTEYENPAPNIFEVEKMKSVHISTTDDPDYGLLRSVVIPYRDRQGREYIIGADIEAAEVAALKRRAFINFLMMGSLSFALAVIFSYLVSFTITKPLALLSSFTRRLCDGGFANDIRLAPEIISSRDGTKSESTLLAFDINRMQDELATHIEQLKLTQSARERAESELRIAGQIQSTFLPPPFKPATFGGAIALHAFMKTAKQAGGDLYDYFQLDDDHLCFSIGDVSGKGMPAAIFMSIVVVLMRAAAKTTYDPAAMVAKINADLAEGNDSCTFVTLFVGVLNVRTGVLNFCNGGHNPARIRHVDGHLEAMDSACNCVVGVMDDATFKAEALVIKPGDLLYFYTDGVTEAIAEDDSFYGEERLDALLRSQPLDSTVAHVNQVVATDVETFAGRHEQADDITMLSLRYQSVVYNTEKGTRV